MSQEGGATSDAGDDKFILPRDPVELTLAKLWIEVLDVELISVRENFFDLGGTSLQLLHVAEGVEARLGRKLPLAAFFHHATIESLGGVVRQQGPPAFESPLLTIRAREGDPPLFLFHDLSGDVTYAYLLAHVLGPCLSVYGFQPPGLYNDREPHRDVGALVDEYVKELLAVQPEGPYALGGHCTGGLLAAEAATRLVASGHEVAPLVLFSSLPWSAKGREQMGSVTDRTYALYHWLDAHAEPLPYERFAALGEEEQHAYLLEGWEALDMVPAGAGVPYLRRYADMYIQSTGAMARHDPSRYDGRGCVFLPSEPVVEGDEVPSPAEVRRRWLEVVGCDVEVQVVPGTHYSMLEREHIEGLVHRVHALLAGGPTAPPPAETPAPA
jgi:thioesterase domain-containing protein